MPRASVNSLPELEALIFVRYTQGQLREVQLFLHNNIDSRLASLEVKVDAGFAEMRGGFAKFDASIKNLLDTIADAVDRALRSRE